MTYPDGRKYTKDHEWIEVAGDRGRVGITDYAQQQLGDVVYVDLPFGARYVEKPEDRAEYEFVFDLVAAKTVPISDWSPG